MFIVVIVEDKIDKEGIIDIVIIFFVTFYLLKDGEAIKDYLAGLFPHRDNRRILNLFNNILRSLRIYICGQMAICAITAMVVFLYFSLRGLPYASVFAVVSGIAEFIPVLGPTVASAFGVMLTATTSPWMALQTAGFYLILTQINHNLVMPNIIGKTLHLHPIAIILGVVLGDELLGAAGMFLVRFVALQWTANPRKSGPSSFNQHALKTGMKKAPMSGCFLRMPFIPY